MIESSESSESAELCYVAIDYYPSRGIKAWYTYYTFSEFLEALGSEYVVGWTVSGKWERPYSIDLSAID